MRERWDRNCFFRQEIGILLPGFIATSTLVSLSVDQLVLGSLFGH